MTPSDLRQSLEAIAATAPALRKAGVSSLQIDGVVVNLAPEIVPVERTPTQFEEADPNTLGVLDDPIAFGVRNGNAPRFRRAEVE